jgi:hypothetical protein
VILSSKMGISRGNTAYERGREDGGKGIIDTIGENRPSTGAEASCRRWELGTKIRDDPTGTSALYCILDDQDNRHLERRYIKKRHARSQIHCEEIFY